MSNTASQRSVPENPVETMSAEKHYSIQELGSLWGLSPQTIRRLFQNEPGVIEISAKATKKKRRYVTLRIPESVAQRVHARLQKPGSVSAAAGAESGVPRRKPLANPARPVVLESAS